MIYNIKVPFEQSRRHFVGTVVVLVATYYKLWDCFEARLCSDKKKHFMGRVIKCVVGINFMI